MPKLSQLLLRFSALFAVIGTFLGSHMAGAGSYAFRPIHAHILVVGWLSLFAWAVYYQVFPVRAKVLATVQAWSAIIGSIGLTVGMWLYFMTPLDLGAFSLIFYIVGGSILMLSFILFLILTLISPAEEKKN